MVTGDDDRRGDDTVRPTEDGAEDRRLLMAPHLRGLEPDPHRGVEVDQKSPGELDEAVPRAEFIRSVVGTIAGLAVAARVYLVMPGDLEHNARLTAAVAVLAWPRLPQRPAVSGP